MTRIFIIASYYLDFSASHWIISKRSSKYSHRVKRYRRLYSINTRNVHKKLIVINSCCCQVNFEVLQRGQELSEVALYFRWNIYQLCAIAVCVFLTHELNLLFMFHVIIAVQISQKHENMNCRCCHHDFEIFELFWRYEETCANNFCGLQLEFIGCWMIFFYLEKLLLLS